MQGPSVPLVVVFDQHAVHERVRLEALLAEHWTRQGGSDNVLGAGQGGCHNILGSNETHAPEKRLLSHCVSPPLPVTLSHAEVLNLFLIAFMPHLERSRYCTFPLHLDATFDR